MFVSELLAYVVLIVLGNVYSVYLYVIVFCDMFFNELLNDKTTYPILSLKNGM